MIDIAYSPQTWFTQIFPLVSSKPLKSLTFPGSHDSGMSKLSGPSALVQAIGPFTQTQTLSIHDQIVLAGIRYIDLRPASVDGEFRAAHWSRIGDDQFIGLAGEPLGEICAGLTAAFSNLGQNEIVFIEVSDGKSLKFVGSVGDSLSNLSWNKISAGPISIDFPSLSPQDLSLMERADLDQGQQSAIMQQIVQSLGSSLYASSTVQNVLELTPADIFTGRSTGPKAILWCSDDSFKDCGFTDAQGVLQSSQVPYYNAWTDVTSNNPDALIAGLATSLVQHAHRCPSGEPYFLTWHCEFEDTEDALGNLQSALDPRLTLSNLASDLNPKFSNVIENWLNNGTIYSETAVPTFVAWDYVTAWDPCDQAMIASCIRLSLLASQASNDPLDYIRLHHQAGSLEAFEQMSSTVLAPQVTSEFISPLDKDHHPTGVGGYNLVDPADRAFAFDFDGSKKNDHLALYRPGKGIMFVLKSEADNFSPVFTSATNGGRPTGIGGYDLADPADRAFAFDYDGSGKDDHLVLYRPGHGTLFILKNEAGNFSPVFTSASNGGRPTGIGGYDLLDPTDRAFAFDYDGSGKSDHLVLYRPGRGTLFILKNDGGNFSPVFTSAWDGGRPTGIGGYDLADPSDRVFALDYTGSGREDHLVLYRPGSGIVFVLKNDAGRFSPAYTAPVSGGRAMGLGDCDLSRPGDELLPIDWYGNGSRRDVVVYGPGTGEMMILANKASSFKWAFVSGSGVGGFALNDARDRACGLDYASSGRMKDIFLYRPGGALAAVVARGAKAVDLPTGPPPRPIGPIGPVT